MTVAVIVMGVLLAVALVFVVALLRSHAEILRRLAALEGPGNTETGGGAGWDGDRPAASGLNAVVGDGRGAGDRVGSGRGAGDRGGGNRDGGGAAADIAGQTLHGDAVKLSLAAGASPTLLAFLGSGCTACVPLWEGLHGTVETPAGARLAVVTKGPERERLARLLELAPETVEVVMSTDAWTDYRVPSTPHFVLVRGGEIAGRGAATSWQQIASLLRDAGDDDRIHRARSTSERAERAERALSEAGVTAGHPSLYPSRLEPAGGETRPGTTPSRLAPAREASDE